MSDRSKPRASALVRIAAASAVVTLAAGQLVHATDYNFNATAGTPADYNTAANWLPVGVPGAADSGFISGGRIATYSTAVTDSLSTLSLGANGGTGTGELRQSAGSLTAAGVQIGHDAGTTTAGLLTLTGGTFTSTGNAVLGEQGTGDNRIAASGGTLNLNGETYLGANGKGTLAVSGTAIVNAGRFDVGNSPNSVGAITVSGGTLNVNNETYVGLRGLGTWTQTGGIANVKRVQIGQENDGPVGGPSGDGKGKGTVSVSGGSMISTDVIVLGEQSREDNQLNVSGTGTVTTPELYNGANGRGTVNVSGAGTLNVAGQMHIGASGTGTGALNVSGGNLNMTGPGGWILVGQNGLGTFNFTAGAIDTKIISVGQDPTSTGTATQTGGTLRAQRTFILGETSTAGGTYTASAGSIDVGTADTADDLDGLGVFVGSYSGKGIFNISGTAAVSSRTGITVGYGEGGGANGTINISGGSLSTVTTGDQGRVRIGVYGGSTGRLNVTGGTVSFAGPILNGVARGGVGVGGNGLIMVGGGSLTSAGLTNETTSSYTQSGGTASLGVVSGGGTFSVNAGTATVARITQQSLSVTGSGTVRLANAATPAASVVSTLTTGGTGKLDITNNGLVVDYDVSGTSPIASIRAALAAGRIVATLTPADGRQSVAYGEAIQLASGGLGDFLGTAVDNSSVVIRSRLRGDRNLDGDVDFDDILGLAMNYDPAGSGKFWTQGDFDYDGIVGFTDLLALTQNYNLTLLSSAGAAIDAQQIGSNQFRSDFALAQSLVPEPVSLLTLGAAGTLLAARRRRA